MFRDVHLNSPKMINKFLIPVAIIAQLVICFILGFGALWFIAYPMGQLGAAVTGAGVLSVLSLMFSSRYRALISILGALLAVAFLVGEYRDEVPIFSQIKVLVLICTELYIGLVKVASRHSDPQR
jgi:hypothetical protein